jgi:uridine kinase
MPKKERDRLCHWRLQTLLKKEYGFEVPLIPVIGSDATPPANLDEKGDLILITTLTPVPLNGEYNVFNYSEDNYVPRSSTAIRQLAREEKMKDLEAMCGAEIARYHEKYGLKYPTATYPRAVKVVAVCGASGSGKTTLVSALAKHFQCNDKEDTIRIDKFYHSEFCPFIEHPYSERNMEVKESIDWPGLVEAIHYKLDELEQREPTCPPFLFVEGVLSLVCDEVLSMVDYKIMCDTPMDMCCKRRIARKVRTNEEEDFLADYFEKYVWDQWYKIQPHCKEALKSNGIIIDGAKSEEEMKDDGISFLEKMRLTN